LGPSFYRKKYSALVLVYIFQAKKKKIGTYIIHLLKKYDFYVCQSRRWPVQEKANMCCNEQQTEIL